MSRESLWRIRGFLPFLLVLIFNAMTDIAHKITIQNVLIKSFSGGKLIVLSAVVNALILIPFVLLFSPAGFISDRYYKTSVARYAALVSVGLALMATFSYYQGWFLIAFSITFLLAVQSAIYSPAKYGLIKELVGAELLAYANGIVQAATITAILGSSLLFSVLFEFLYKGGSQPHAILQSIAPIGWGLVVMTVAESWFAFRIPNTGVRESSLTFEAKRYLRLDYLKANVSLIRENSIIWLCIMGLSLFWGVSQLAVAAFPAHYKAVLRDENTVVIQGILAVSAIGLILGSVVAGRASKKRIEFGIIPLGALGMFVALMIFATARQVSLMVAASVSFGFFGGLVVVPFNAALQYLAPREKLGTVLAGSNFVQNIVMILFLVATVAAVAVGFSSRGIFYLAAVITFCCSVYIFSRIPQLVGRLLLLPILRTRYRLFVRGIENLPQTGGVLLLGNHVSWIDWLVLQVASPRAIKFVMERRIYEQWYLKRFLQWFKVIPISSVSSKHAIEEVRDRLNNGEVVAIFPEGHISYSGQLGEFKRGFELIMREVDHPIVPFYLHGLWGSAFSRAGARYRMVSKTGPRRDIGVVFGKPLPSKATAYQVKQAVKALSMEAWEETVSSMEPFHYQWLKRCKAGPFKKAVADSTGTELTRAKLLSAVLLFSKALKEPLKNETNVGVILPSSAVGAIVNMALFVLGKRPVNLNYTLSVDALESSIERAELKTVISSSLFLKRLSSKGFDLSDLVLQVEDLSRLFSESDKRWAFVEALLMPAWLIRMRHFKRVSLNDTATILFSSGSEGVPKGVELTHKNLIGNIKQVSAMVNFQDDEVILNSLPIFHSFGFTVTTLLPLCEGIPMVCVPDPTEALTVGKMVVRHRATIIFGTSTFFRIYTKNRRLHPLMFKSLRMAVAGAERLKPEIKEAFKAKFGVDLLEGYGTTETSPVISVNLPDSIDPHTFQVIVGNKSGSVGQALPGTMVRVVDPDTFEELPAGEDGLIVVGGVQVMKGYLKDPKKTAEVITEVKSVRYYRTGDKGHIDEDGFIFIVDRYSRFAKVGGEMISLGSVEEQVENLFGEGFECVAVGVPHERKGEAVVLLYSAGLEPEEVMARIRSSEIPTLIQPSKVLKVEHLPKLASGKTDMKRAKVMVMEGCL